MTDYDYIFEKPSQEDVLKELQTSVLFKDCTKKELKAISKVCTLREFKKGQHVFFEKDPGSALYVIIKGKVEIKQHTKAKFRTLAILGRGMFFGEVALFDQAPRSATALALEDLYLLCIFRHDLNKLVARYPELGNKLLYTLACVLAQRLRVTNERLREISV